MRNCGRRCATPRMARGQPASSARMGLALAEMDSVRESRTPAGGLRTPVRLGRACERAGCGWHVRGRHDDCRVARRQEDAPGCGHPLMVRLAPTGHSSLEAGPTKRDAVMPDAVPVMRPKLPAASSVLPYLSEIDASRIYSNFGPLAVRLEHRLAAHFGVGDHAVTTVANATLGLALALTAQQVTAGTLCVIPAWTFVASPQAASLAGLTPYFVDVDPRTWALEPDAIDGIIAQCSRRGRCGHAGRTLRPADRSVSVGSIPLANRVGGRHRCGRRVRCCLRNWHTHRRQPACHEGVRDG